jgi:hypothetical protein
MTLGRILGYLGVWSAIGCAVFSAYVVVVFRTGIVYTARKEDGTLKKRVPLSGYLNMLFLLSGIIGLQVVANYFGLARQALEVRFLSLFLLNFGHYLILFLFDTLVIDGLVLSVWRPAFLQLSDALGQESMKQHILISIPIGTLAGIGLTAVSTAISYFALFSG